MPSVVLSTKDAAAIEAAAELLKDNKKLAAQLLRLSDKYDKALIRSRGMNFKRFAEVANEEMGVGNWVVLSPGKLVTFIRNCCLSEEHVKTVIRRMMATKPSPWEGFEWEISKYAKELATGKSREDTSGDSSAKTGVIQDL